MTLFLLAALSETAMTTPFISGSNLLPDRYDLMPEYSSNMISEIEVDTPDGWINYCMRNITECDNLETKSQFIQLTVESIENLNKINTFVNSRIIARSDMAHNNTSDYWDVPKDNYGDCEDYALMKRKLLIEAGFSKGALLMTMVKLETGELHAVLTVITQHGDYILDNLSESISPWFNKPFKYLKRQSKHNQNIWTSLNGAPVSSQSSNS